MEKSKTPIILKTSGRRAKRSEIWDSWIIFLHIWGTFDLLAFSHFGSFGALAIFRNLGLMIRDHARTPYERL